MRAALVAWIGACACACSPDSRAVPSVPDLLLSLRGHDVAPLSLAAMRKLGDERITVFDPHEHAAIQMRAVPLPRVLDRAFGEGWRGAEEAVASCADGFRPAIPLSLVRERGAYLAYARVDSPDFGVQETQAKRTPVGPYYVVWKATASSPEGDPPEPDWPYQVNAMEVTDYAARFAATEPPKDADDAARRGFERFRTVCLPCHMMNGSGGAVGPELNYPLNVTEYFAEPILRTWITDPQRVRHGAKMPRPLPEGADRDRAIDEIVAYLKAMSRKKRSTSEP